MFWVLEEKDMDIDRIKGIIPAVVTPFTKDEKLNEEGLRVILDRLIEKSKGLPDW